MAQTDFMDVDAWTQNELMTDFGFGLTDTKEEFAADPGLFSSNFAVYPPTEAAFEQEAPQVKTEPVLSFSPNDTEEMDAELSDDAFSHESSTSSLPKARRVAKTNNHVDADAPKLLRGRESANKYAN